MYSKYLKTPRGIRNHNPGNIELNGTQWEGMRPIQTDERFVQFESPEYGIRAMTRILNSYAARGVDTVREIINTWAPPVENNTASYIASVAGSLGIHPDTPITKNHYPVLISAIIRHENGTQPYSVQVIQAGVMMA